MFLADNVMLNLKLRPEVCYIDIINYVVFSEGVDGEEIWNYKSTEAYNYLHSNKTNQVLYRKQGDYIVLKADAEPSQKVSQAKHPSWVISFRCLVTGEGSYPRYRPGSGFVRKMIRAHVLSLGVY